jgi:hypothetical protein
LTEAPPPAALRTATVDEERRIVQSSVPQLAEGETLRAESWLGAVLLEAVATAGTTGAAQTRVGRDYLHGTHWVVTATLASREPWRATVSLFDATAAVDEDREAILSKLIHAFQNGHFAMRTVLEAIELDGPTGPALAEYCAHLRSPSERLSTTMARLADCIHTRRPSQRSVTIGALLEHALTRVAARHKPAEVNVPEALTPVQVDLAMISDTLAALLESDGAGSDSRVTAEPGDRGERRGVRFSVERAVPTGDDKDPGALWDVAAGRGLEGPLRLTVGRAAVLAHGGAVFAERVRDGRVRLGFWLPRA